MTSLQPSASCELENTNEDRLRVLELYSGIGGMRYALEAAGMTFEIIAAIDMNPVVNEIYTHNFGTKGHYQRNLNAFTTKDIQDMKVDVITMSPPCQPFTRVGLKKDIKDSRSDSFLHILKILTQLQKKPSFIILENVQGFEISEARKVLVQTLEQCNYRYQEFLLSPQDLDVPNSRLRYYMTAKLESPSELIALEKMCHGVPTSSYSWKSNCAVCANEKKSGLMTCSLKHFIEKNNSDYFEPYLVPDHILLKYWAVFDIVDENSKTCCCFTKAYSHYAQGTGSVLVTLNDPLKVTETFEKVAITEDTNEKLKLLKSLELRYFTPNEIANIMCFPKSFTFPSSITLKQRYKSLGNSLNVFVVTCLIQSLFNGKLFPRVC